MPGGGKIYTFSDLIVWQEGHKLVLDIYQITKSFPREESFGLASQMRRCVVSITSNIAEGFSRQSYKEKVQFYCIALGSVTELQNQVVIARDVGFIILDRFQELTERSLLIHRMLNGLIKKSKYYIP